MKRYLLLTAAACLLACNALFILPVNAQEETPVSEETTQQQEDGTTDKNSRNNSTQKDTKAEARAERLEKIKTARQEKLSEIEAKRIMNRCKPAQNKLASLQQSDAVKVNAFTDKYNRVLSRFDLILQRLVAAGIDTTELERVYQDAMGDINQLTTDMNAYLMTLEDLSVLDCEADPEAFQAALVTIRENRLVIKDQVKSIREFFQTNVRESLLAVKSQLKSETDEESEQSETLDNETETENEVSDPAPLEPEDETNQEAPVEQEETQVNGQ